MKIFEDNETSRTDEANEAVKQFADAIKPVWANLKEKGWTKWEINILAEHAVRQEDIWTCLGLDDIDNETG